MLSPKLYIPSPVSVRPVRVWRFAFYAMLIIVLTQLVTPTQLGWVVPLTRTAAPAVVNTSPLMMHHQPVEVTALNDLWSSHASYATVQKVVTAVPGTSELATTISHPTFSAELRLNRDNVAQFNEGAVSIFVEHGTFATPTQLEFTPLAQSGRTTVTSDDEETFFRFQVEARDNLTGQLYDQFDQPVRLTLDFSQIGIDLSAGYSDLFLAYRDEENPNLWHQVDIEVPQLARGVPTHLTTAGLRPSRLRTNCTPRNQLYH